MCGVETLETNTAPQPRPCRGEEAEDKAVEVTVISTSVQVGAEGGEHILVVAGATLDAHQPRLRDGVALLDDVRPRTWELSGSRDLVSAPDVLRSSPSGSQAHRSPKRGRYEATWWRCDIHQWDREWICKALARGAVEQSLWAPERMGTRLSMRVLYVGAWGDLR